MNNISRYLEYLPSALFGNDKESDDLLGRMLCVFERILTGIEDDTCLVHKDRLYDPLEKTIAELSHLFSAWQTRPELLDWLAKWVALSLPQNLTEHQKRKLIAQMADIYRLRGRKEGLHAYFDLFASTQASPRIAIDDSEAIWRGTVQEDGLVNLTCVAHSYGLDDVVVLQRPTALAVDLHGNYIIADAAGGELGEVPPALWKMSRNGHIEFTGDSAGRPLPKPLYMDPVQTDQRRLIDAVAIVADRQNHYYVLNIGKEISGSPNKPNSTIYEVQPSQGTLVAVIAPNVLEAVYPVDMVLDLSGKFVVLDRGVRSGDTTLPAIRILSKVGGEPLEIALHGLADGDVIEPSAITVIPEGKFAGCFVVGDARQQMTSEAARLALVNPADKSVTWIPVDAEPNPAIATPVGLLPESPTSILVLESGVRSGRTYNRGMAKPAALYRVNLSGWMRHGLAPKVTQISSGRKLAFPTKMATEGAGRVVITDKGCDKPSARTRAHEFDLEVLFSIEKFPPRDPKKFAEAIIVWEAIDRIVAGQKPAHTVGRVKTLDT